MRLNAGRCKNDRRDADGPAHGPLFRGEMCQVCYARHMLNQKRRTREKRIEQVRAQRRNASDPLRREILKQDLVRLKSERLAIIEQLAQLDPSLPSNEEEPEEPEAHVGAA